MVCSKNLFWPKSRNKFHLHLKLLSSSLDSSAQRARANLYGALLNYLRIGHCDDATSMTDSGRLRKANCDVLASFGDVFIDVVCKDAVSGHDVRKMLALSLLVREIDLYLVCKLKNLR